MNLQHFEYEHLPPHLKEISSPLCDLAKDYDRLLPDCAEKSAGLRKLMEAKDCLVRARIEQNMSQKEDTASIVAMVLDGYPIVAKYNKGETARALKGAMAQCVQEKLKRMRGSSVKKIVSEVRKDFSAFIDFPEKA